MLYNQQHMRRTKAFMLNKSESFLLFSFFGGLECVGYRYYFAYVPYFVFWRDVWIRTQRAAVATHLPNLATHLPNLEPPIALNLATHLHQLIHPFF